MLQRAGMLQAWGFTDVFPRLRRPRHYSCTGVAQPHRAMATGEAFSCIGACTAISASAMGLLRCRETQVCAVAGHAVPTLQDMRHDTD